MSTYKATTNVLNSALFHSTKDEHDFEWSVNLNRTNPFSAAYIQFRNYLGYTKPLSYDEWVLQPTDHKAVYLYVQFYDQITLAWYKAHKLWGDPEEGVETVLMYLFNKNVKIIEEKPSRFTPAYIYRVAYNCLYCICHDRKCDRDRWNLEISNIVMTDDDELDLFDTVPDVVEMEKVSARERMWQVVESLDEESQLVIAELLGEPDGKQAKKISADRKRDIIIKLRDVLAEFHEVFCE